MNISTATLAAAIGLTAVLPLAGCSAAGGGSSPGSADAATSVVATTTILGSVVGDIVSCADPEGSVTTLMPIGADPHDFSPSSAQVAQIVTADIVVANGLGLEGGLTDALANAAADGAAIINVGDLVDPITFGGHAGDHAGEVAGEDEHQSGDADPHVWFDMTRMAAAAQIIGDELAASGNTAFSSCGSQVADEIRAAEAGVRSTLESVPADRRILVTDHDAFGYLADAYGYEIAGTVIPAGTTLAEPSSAELSDLVSVIRAEGVPAIFANTSDSTALSDAVAAEVGSDVQVVKLYVGSLGEPGSGADTYITMMQTNASLIATALNR